MSDAAPPQTLFNIEKLYVKDLSLEIPHAPGIFLERENPQIDLQLHSQVTSIEEGMFEVSVTVTVTAKLASKDKVMFLIEVKQAGVFQIRNFPQEELEPMLGVACPNILYPYLREVVSDVAGAPGLRRCCSVRSISTYSINSRNSSKRRLWNRLSIESCTKEGGCRNDKIVSSPHPIHFFMCSNRALTCTGLCIGRSGFRHSLRCPLDQGKKNICGQSLLALGAGRQLGCLGQGARQFR